VVSTSLPVPTLVLLSAPGVDSESGSAVDCSEPAEGKKRRVLKPEMDRQDS
jgi:hypothetical protein